MSLDVLLAHRDLIVALSAAVAVSCTVLALGWPYLAASQVEQRMRRVLDTRGLDQVKEAQRNAGKRRTLLGSEPSKLMAAIFDRFRLARKLQDGATVDMLKTAGLRGRAPAITYLAMRLLMPVIVFSVVGFYIFVVIKPEIALILKLVIMCAAGYLGHYLPLVYVKNRITKRRKSIKRAWPDALDLLLICVESGMSSEHAFRKVADEIGNQSRDLAEELSITTAELSFLSDRRAAYENLGKRTDIDVVRSVVTGLMQSEKYGTSLGNALRVLAQENRAMRMSEAEKKAAALPPKLTVPMILFFLPVLFAVVITPAAIQIINN